MKNSLAVALALLLCGCGSIGTKPDAYVTGTVTYRERILVPESAVLTVQLSDVSLADAPSTTLAEQRIQPVRVPEPFSLAYDPAKIDPRHSYAVSASIHDEDGNLLFVTDERHAVLTGGEGDKVEIVLTHAAR